eukprot:COSAG01_NODE_4161_length_5283_cov_38.647184_3_plen_223_part_00
MAAAGAATGGAATGGAAPGGAATSSSSSAINIRENLRGLFQDKDDRNVDGFARWRPLRVSLSVDRLSAPWPWPWQPLAALAPSPFKDSFQPSVDCPLSTPCQLSGADRGCVCSQNIKMEVEATPAQLLAVHAALSAMVRLREDELRRHSQDRRSGHQGLCMPDVSPVSIYLSIYLSIYVSDIDEWVSWAGTSTRKPCQNKLAAEMQNQHHQASVFTCTGERV